MTDEERVRDLLGEAFAIDPPPGVGVRPGDVQAARRRRRAAASLSSVTVVVLAVVAAVAVPRAVGGASHRSPEQTGAATGSTPTPSLYPSQAAVAAAVAAGKLVEDGDTVEASGRVVKVPDKPLRFCGPEEFDAVAYAPGHEPAPSWCPLGVDVEGVDLSKLTDYRTKAGATEGFAYLRGTWRGDTLHVSVQTAPRYAAEPSHDINPAACHKPSSGWPRSTSPNPPQVVQDRIRAFEASHPDEVVTLAVARPTSSFSYWVVAVEDVGAAAAALLPYPGKLCVIKSKFSRADIAAARAPFDADARAHLKDGGGVVATTGESVSSEGQPLVDAQVLMMTAEVRHWISSAPAGLLDVTPWLKVVSAGAPLPALPTSPTSVSPFTTAPAAAASSSG